MMLGDQHYVSDSRRLRRLHPLLWVYIRRIENGGVGGAVSPLAIHKCIRTEVNDRAHLKVLPRDLLRTGLDVGEILRGREHGRENDYTAERSRSAKCGVHILADSTLPAYSSAVRTLLSRFANFATFCSKFADRTPESSE